MRASLVAVVLAQVLGGLPRLAAAESAGAPAQPSTTRGTADGGVRPGPSPQAGRGSPAAAPPQGAPSFKPDAGARAVADAGTAPLRPLLVISEDPAVLQHYGELKPAARAQQKTTTVLRIGTGYAVGLFADGYSLPFSRVVDLSADLTITDSTGRVVLERASIARANTMDPLKHLATPLTPDVRLFYGLTDPEGTYSAHLSIFDHVRGSVTRADFTFQVKR